MSQGPGTDEYRQPCSPYGDCQGHGRAQGRFLCSGAPPTAPSIPCFPEAVLLAVPLSRRTPGLRGRPAELFVSQGHRDPGRAGRAQAS